MGGAITTAEPTVLPLAGELCIAELPEVRALIDEAVNAGTVELALDLTEVTLVTAAALRVFATTEARLAAQGGTLRLRNPQGLPRRVLQIAGFDHLVDPSVAV